MSENRGVCCGEIIPEGQQVCEMCKRNTYVHTETADEKLERIIWDWVIPLVFLFVIVAVILILKGK